MFFLHASDFVVETKLLFFSQGILNRHDTFILTGFEVLLLRGYVMSHDASQISMSMYTYVCICKYDIQNYAYMYMYMHMFLDITCQNQRNHAFQLECGWILPASVSCMKPHQPATVS